MQSRNGNGRTFAVIRPTAHVYKAAVIDSFRGRLIVYYFVD